MPFAICYISQNTNKTRYWSTKHSFVNTLDNNIVMVQSIKQGIKTIQNAIRKYPTKFKGIRKLENYYLVDTNTGQQTNWMTHVHSNVKSYILTRVTKNGTIMYRMSDGNWTNNGENSTISKYNNLDHAKQELNNIDQFSPTLKDKSLSLNVINSFNNQVEYSINPEPNNNKIQKEIQDMSTSPSPNVKPIPNPIIKHSEQTSPHLEDTKTDINIYDIMEAIGLLARLSNQTDSLLKLVKKIEKTDTIDLMHIIELDQLSNTEKVQIVDKLTKLRQQRRIYKDLALYGQAIKDSIDFTKLEKELNDNNVENLNHREYHFKNKDLGNWWRQIQANNEAKQEKIAQEESAKEDNEDKETKNITEKSQQEETPKQAISPNKVAIPTQNNDNSITDAKLESVENQQTDIQPSYNTDKDSIAKPETDDQVTSDHNTQPESNQNTLTKSTNTRDPKPDSSSDSTKNSKSRDPFEDDPNNSSSNSTDTKKNLNDLYFM